METTRKIARSDTVLEVRDGDNGRVQVRYVEPLTSCWFKEQFDWGALMLAGWREVVAE